MSMKKGTVKWFNRDEGYGYISPDDGSEDLFYGYSAIAGRRDRLLEKGARVTYDVVDDWRGSLQAANVSRA
jgi:cold shock protein